MLLSSNSTCFVSGFVIFRCFCLRCSIYFVAVDDNVIVCIVVLVITLVLATSLAVVHINVSHCYICSSQLHDLIRQRQFKTSFSLSVRLMFSASF